MSEVFQSLKGKIQTAELKKKLEKLEKGFNPSKVRYKRMTLATLELPHWEFQSLKGKIQTFDKTGLIRWMIAFQSLKGKIQTRCRSLGLRGMLVVSIPQR